MKRKIILFILLGLALMLAGCGSGSSSVQGESITGKIVAVTLDGPLKTGPLSAGDTLELTENDLKFFLPDNAKSQSYIGKGYTVVIRGEFTKEPATSDWCPGDHIWNKLQPQDVRFQERNGRFCLDLATVIAKATANGRLSDISWGNSRYGGVQLVVFDTNGNRLTELSYPCQLNIMAGHPRETPVANANIVVQNTNITTKSWIDGSFILTGLSEGSHYLIIEANGYTTRTVLVNEPGDITIGMGYNIIQN